MGMRITVQPETFQLAQVFTISRGSRSQAEVLTVRIEKDGVIGWGECVPYARYGESLASVTAQINALGHISHEELGEALPAGAARNAVDCAFWDLEAKTSGCFGGTARWLARSSAANYRLYPVFGQSGGHGASSQAQCASAFAENQAGNA